MSFGKYNRRQYLDAPAGDQNLIEKAMKLGQQHQAAKESAQHSLFGASAFGARHAPLPKMHEMEPWSKTEQLRREKEVVGFYLSGHPLDSLQAWKSDAYCTCGAGQAGRDQKGKEMAVAGLIINVLFNTTKSGQPMAPFTIEDYETEHQPGAVPRRLHAGSGRSSTPRNYPNEQVPPMLRSGQAWSCAATPRTSGTCESRTCEPLAEVAEKLQQRRARDAWTCAP
ncbi:MAG: hypothetical protein WKG07_27970 [Hymenobacter sp.]